MSKYELIIFDLDGTLADTSAGIYDCHRYTNRAMGKSVPSDEELSGIIGGPLLKTYIERFGYSDKDAVRAVKIYREHYAAAGIKGASLYPNIAETLQTLKTRGYKLAVATLKSDILAKSILTDLGVVSEFDVIHGMDGEDKLTKCDLLLKCVNDLGSDKTKSVLIGDSIHDALGAEEAQVDFVACTYGFGFKIDGDLSEVDTISVVNSPIELLSVFE